MVADNLPPPAQVVQLMKSKNIQNIRLFNPNPDALNALRGSGIQVILGVVNLDLINLASSPAAAASWVQTNVAPYAADITFRCIAAGNEIPIPSDLSGYLIPAMHNLKAALNAANFKIPVSTAGYGLWLDNTYPPSATTWNNSAAPVTGQIAQFLQNYSYPMLVNAYPFFAYSGNPKEIRLDYALGNATEVVVHDGDLGYKNLLDAMVDGWYAALEKSGGPNVEVIVSETGWPSAGADIATMAYAQTHNNLVVSRVHAGKGTPKRPISAVDIYLFAMFNEDQKPAGTEQNFGLFHPDMSAVYHIDW
ncbi:glucan endo-1,3-beta-glucosidase-like [Tripterygium wilfordii]|nr:glucan endo-1,3-beta-glucosidase-like [Tripterygium wilfordii]XP_038722649.1 glucan endo-1,3-beta-glucosidase-like [Tripterygium wilfordii]XP_038722650.1 glucan endo-1,3-beta-glucosidase-like [Tripterygium wilfordii]XP_038722651.1 glucan endo-1,3-beta-glucosidase-like [Tripterygium wilfordii]